MGIAKNETIKTQCDYYSVLGWVLDCWTVLLKNILTYLELVRLHLLRAKKRGRNKKLP
jgi:hypothetical protein